MESEVTRRWIETMRGEEIEGRRRSEESQRVRRHFWRSIESKFSPLLKIEDDKESSKLWFFYQARLFPGYFNKNISYRIRFSSLHNVSSLLFINGKTLTQLLTEQATIKHGISCFYLESKRVREEESKTGGLQVKC